MLQFIARYAKTLKREVDSKFAEFRRRLAAQHGIHVKLTNFLSTGSASLLVIAPTKMSLKPCMATVPARILLHAG